MPKKIGTDFHMVANDIYQAYDEGKKPQEKDLTELYELSKEFVKDYEERKEKLMTKEIDTRITDLHMAKIKNKAENRLHEYNKLTESLEDLVGELQRSKVSTEDAVGSLKALVNYYSTEKVVFLNDEEHEFLVNELGENRIRSQELLDDEEPMGENIDGYKREVRLFDAVLKKIATKKGRQDPIENEPMCTHCHSSDVYSLSEDDEPYIGHCNECDKDRDLTICELDEKGKVK